MPRQTSAGPKLLHVFLVDRPVGQIEQDKSGALSFAYDDAWRNGAIQIPLSLSMPLAQKRYEDATIEAWLWGLLPENPALLQSWGRQFQVSPNAFALLSAVGADCAGAVQFLTPEALENRTHDAIEWLAEAEIGRRLGMLRQNGSAGRRLGDSGQFSLAGAQPKTALYFDPQGKRWGVPSGRIPTTHILKPPMPHLQGQVENEHFCLLLAAKAGLRAAKSSVMTFDGERVIVVERYDRLRRGDRVIRVHQEDMCQASGVRPELKYEKDGGPGVVAITRDVLSKSDRPDIDRWRFIEAIVFNFLIVGTDAHAKNYSMLLGPKGSARFAPLYDVVSVLPHLGKDELNVDFQKLKLAMRIGGYHAVDAIYPRHWDETSEEAGLQADTVMGLLRHHIATLGDLASDTAAEASDLHHPVLNRLVDCLNSRLKGLIKHYGAESLPAKERPWASFDSPRKAA
ncbi:MAG: type II toxin-antitoxin system HipA family toxin [Methylocystis sp.]